MHIIEVAPIAKGAAKQPLSYYTSKPVTIGDIVRMPMRNRSVYGLVIGISAVEDIKSVVKTSGFALKKIETVLPGRLFTSEFGKAVSKIADWSATDIGSVIMSLCPAPIFEEAERIVRECPVPANELLEPEEGKTKPEILALQSPDDDRIGHYKSLVRESFARNTSVFFCVPTVQHVERIANELKRGIEHAVFAFSGSLSKREVVSRWIKVLSSTRPVVIVATGTFLSLPRQDIGTYVIEHELSSAFRMPVRPYLDLRTAAEYIAGAHHAVTIIAGSLLRINTLWRLGEHTIGEYTPLQFRSLSTAQCTVLPMKDLGEHRESFVLHPEIITLLRYAHHRNERIFLFNSRRGLAPIVICKDCGRLVKCTECDAPVSLYGAQQETAANEGSQYQSSGVFACHRCGHKRDALERCSHCESWNLVPLGIGAETVAAEVAKVLPNAKICILTSDTIKNRTAANKLVDEFYTHAGSIMIGTEMALPFLSQPIEHTVAVSIDPLLSLPDFTIHERIMHILLSLRRIATHSCTYQTRADDTRLFTLAATGNLIDYHRDEIAERKQLEYPPYSLFITTTIAGTKEAVVREMERIKGLIEAADPALEFSIFPAFVPVVKGKYIVNGLLKLPRQRWIHARVLQVLRSLPPYVRCIVDADSIM